MNIDPNVAIELVNNTGSNSSILSLVITGVVTFLVGGFGVKSKGIKGFIQGRFKF